METPGKEGVIGLQELKKFMQKVNCKITTNILKEKFSKYDIGSTGDIGFDDFCSVIQELNFPRQLFRDVFTSLSVDSKRVTITDFQQFLEKEQGESFESDDAKKSIAERMRHFLQDSSRDVQEPYFTVSEFIDWLFSRENQVFDAQQVKYVKH
jgi:phosphatidylinositol phospholipase C gamma-1